MNVCSWHIADVPLVLTNVCFEGKNGHDAVVTRCLLMTHSGHRCLTEPRSPRLPFLDLTALSRLGSRPSPDSEDDLADEAAFHIQPVAKQMQNFQN